MVMFRKRSYMYFSFLGLLALFFILKFFPQNSVTQESNLQDRIRSLKQQVVELRRAAGRCDRKSMRESVVDPNLPVIYAVTPTYARPVQKAELVRLSQTFLHVLNFHWIVIEDSPVKTQLVTNLLWRSGLIYTHLNAATPPEWKLEPQDQHWRKPRGVVQRNTGLDWIRANLDPRHDHGVVYFADDDNTYDLQLFEEMRFTKRVSVWPVGLVSGLMVERPKVDQFGKVTSWITMWKPDRPFAIDMAGFAINLHLFLANPEAIFSYKVEMGYQETELLKHLITIDRLEVKAENCTKVLVWHTRTESPKLKQELKLIDKGKRSDFMIEV